MAIPERKYLNLPNSGTATSTVHPMQADNCGFFLACPRLQKVYTLETDLFIAAFIMVPILAIVESDTAVRSIAGHIEKRKFLKST